MSKSTVNQQSRSQVYRSRDQYIVIDRWSESIVLITTSKRVADYWAQRVNVCEHPIHYDITDHDQRVQQQQSH